MSTPPAPAIWTPPARVRGSLAVVTGRGESAGVYERFGRRLSADGYTVAVFDGAAEATDWLSSADAPRVLVGSDSGASNVLDALAAGADLDAAIVAGVVVDIDAAAPADEQRTACPLHLGVLAELTPVATEQASPLPDAADLAAVAVPVLAVHGGADPVSPFTEAVAALRAVPQIEIVETVDGLHDALNDQSHRSVAATIVLWLERLRTGAATPVVRSIDVVAA